MCFTEGQSFINGIVLILGSIFVYPNWRLSAGLFFLSFKDIIQGLSYRNLRLNMSTEWLTTLSWIHISFQPLFVNLFFSHFDQSYKHWNIIFAVCLLFALYNITVLKTFDIQNDGKCTRLHEKDDFCSEKTESYIGKYHLGYKFETDNNRYLSIAGIFTTLMFIPNLFTKSKLLGLVWLVSVSSIWITLLLQNIPDGEIAAIWCFTVIFFCLPIALFEKQITMILKKYST